MLKGEVHLKGQGRLRGQRALLTLRGAHEPFLDQTWSSLGGRFQFKNLAAGVYILSAQLPGLTESRSSIDVSSGLADSEGRIHRVIVLEPGFAQDAGQVSVAELSVSRAAWKAYSKAEKLLGEGKIDRAVLELKKAVDKQPRFAQAHNLLGTIFYQRQDYAGAESHFRKAMEADSDAYAPLVNLGGALASQGRLKEAVAINREALLKRPDDPLANSQLGLSYWGLGKATEAIEFLTRAKQLDPGHFSYPQLALAEIFLQGGELAKAEQELKEFLRLHPDAKQASPARLLLEQLADRQRSP